jgi:hypothetical protein
MNARTVRVALLCALLVAASGCSALPTNDGPTTETTEAPTTRATTESPTTQSSTTTSEPGQLAPGVTLSGVTDPLALANAHREQLRSEQWVGTWSSERTNESRTVTRQTTVQYASESNWRWNRSATGQPVSLGITNGSLVQYADGERVLWRLDATGDATRENVTYGVRWVSAEERVPTPPAEVFPGTLYERGLVYTLLANANTSVNTVQGATAYVEGTAEEMTIGGQRATNVSFEAAFDNSGRLLRLELTYDQGEATVTRRLAYETVQRNPVEEPDWYDTALNRTNATAE